MNSPVNTDSGSPDGKEFACVTLLESEARYERKFYVTELSPLEMLALIRHNPAVFREIFYKRFVNNLYLDTPDLRFYNENVVGADQRQKVRIRWYGDLLGEISQPTLEIKIKSGLIGTKRSYRLPPLQMKPGFKFVDWLALLRKSEVPDCLCSWLAQYQPSLINRYARQYFLSADKAFRATIDSEMCFGSLGRMADTLLRWAEGCPHTVMELKYPPEFEPAAADITSVLPFRVTKSSKYVNGIEAVRTSCGHSRELCKTIRD